MIQLTTRQAEVCALLVEGASVKEAASALQISPGTVKVHAHALYRRLGVHNRAGLVKAINKLQSERIEP